MRLGGGIGLCRAREGVKKGSANWKRARRAQYRHVGSGGRNHVFISKEIVTGKYGRREKMPQSESLTKPVSANDCLRIMSTTSANTLRMLFVLVAVVTCT